MTMENKTTSLYDHEVKSHHQPILLTRSDTFQPYQAITSPSIATTTVTATATIASEENDTDNGDNVTSSKQDKRKWDQVGDDSTKTNTYKVPMYDHSNQSLPSITTEDEDESQDSDDPQASNGKRLGRKPMADEEPSDDGDPKVKRKAQNRAAQRAFRDRKERYVKELESRLKQVQDTHVMATNHLFQENHQLRSIIYRLETENVALKGIHIQHGPLSGKPVQCWMEALQEHQQRFPSFALSSTPHQNSMFSTGSIYTHQSQDTSSSSSLANLAPAPVMPNSASPSPSTASNQLSNDTPSTVVTQPRQQQNQVKYTFSISTPATLRSRHKQQQQQENRASASPPTVPKQQRSPVELVRLYPHEHSTIASTPSMIPALPSASTGNSNAHHLPQSPASSVSASTHGSLSAAQTPTIECQAFCDKLQEEVCTNAFDQLLSEPLFDTTTGGLNASLGFPHLDEEHPLIYRNQESHQNQDHQRFSTTSPPSSYDTTADDSDKSNQQQQLHPSSSASSSSAITDFLSGQEIYDRLHQHSRFEQYSSSQLLAMVKSMAKCTHLGPVVTEQDLKIVLAKMDEGCI